jgi:hypothetical protein
MSTWLKEVKKVIWMNRLLASRVTGSRQQF